MSFGAPFASHSFTVVRFSKSAAPAIVDGTAFVVLDRVIPLRIDGVALLGNVIVYTAIFVCGYISIAVRRNARTRRGHCVKCGYDLFGGLKRCPECGRLNVRGS